MTKEEIKSLQDMRPTLIMDLAERMHTAIGQYTEPGELQDYLKGMVELTKQEFIDLYNMDQKDLSNFLILGISMAPVNDRIEDFDAWFSSVMQAYRKETDWS